MSNKDFIEVGKRIESCRKARGMTLDEVGRLLGLHRSSILRYENGYTKQIKLVVLERLAEILNTTPEYLMTGFDSSSDNEENDEIDNCADSFNNSLNTSVTEQSVFSYDYADDTATFEGDNDSPMLASPIKYNVETVSDTLLNEDEIASLYSKDKLPHKFSFVSTSCDFTQRISPGDILTMSTAESTVDGSIYLFLTRDKLLILRRVFHNSQGYTLTCDNPDIIPITIPYIGKNSGYSLIARLTSLFIEFK